MNHKVNIFLLDMIQMWEKLYQTFYAYFSRYVFAFVAGSRISKVPFGKYNQGVIKPHFFILVSTNVLFLLCSYDYSIQTGLPRNFFSISVYTGILWMRTQWIYFQSQLSALLYLKGNLKNFNRLFLRKKLVHIHHINSLPIFS